MSEIKVYEKGSLRKKLERNKDYIIINQFLWLFFVSNYNSNIEIVLNGNNDIYNNFETINTLNIAFKYFEGFNIIQEVKEDTSIVENKSFIPEEEYSDDDEIIHFSDVELDLNDYHNSNMKVNLQEAKKDIGI